MWESTSLFSFFGVKIYPFGCCLAAGALLCLLYLLSAEKKRLPVATLLYFAAWALPCGLLGARLGYCAVRAGKIAVDFGFGFLSRLDWGGFSLAGGFLGVLLAAWLTAKQAKLPMRDVLNAAAAALLLFLACERFAERLTTEGVGGFVEAEGLQGFPFAVQDEYGDHRFAVFFWEGLTALGLAAALHISRRAEDRDVFQQGMLLFGATQLFWESLRQDNFLRFGFVRVNQLFAIALVLAAVLLWLKRAGLKRGVNAAVAAGYLAGVGVLVAIEFGLDKSQLSNALLYAVMAIILVGMIVGGYALRLRAGAGRLTA